VNVNGVSVKVQTDGSILAYTNGQVQVKPAANDDVKLSATPQAGQEMDDGSICLGVSPETGKPFYAAEADESLTMKWKDAMKAAAKKNAHGHTDWRLPTKDELQVMFDNREKGALKGTFNQTGAGPEGWYLSSTEGRLDSDCAWGQGFGGGYPGWYHKGDLSSVRCVRG